MSSWIARESVALTSEVYNEAENIFNLLQNKDKLVSFLDCTTLLRGMGMNPTPSDMDKLKERMAEPIMRLEHWRREEELKREKERRKEEMRERKGMVREKPKSRKSTTNDRKKTIVEKAGEAGEKQVKVVPVEEIKNIDWNIFISCAEEIFRDAMTEQAAVLHALKVFQGGVAEEAYEVNATNSPGLSAPPRRTFPRDRLIEIVTSNGDNVLTPSEVKQLKTMLPDESYDLAELAARLQGTYVPPTQAELDRAAAEAMAARKRREDAEKAAAATAEDPLAGL